MSLIYDGPFRDAGGYSKMNREIVRWLVKLGADVKTSIISPNRKCFELDISDIEALSNKDITSAPTIHGCLAPGFFPNNKQPHIVYTMMETDTINKSYVQKCNCADMLFVPCDWNIKTFSESGVKRPIKKIPLGVDTQLYNPEVKPKYNFENKFVFLSLFGWSLRKGPDILIKGFLKAFGDNPNYVLLIASRIWGSEEKNHIETIQNDIRRFKEQAGFPNAENIIHLAYGFKEEDLPSLYKSANCFVLPSRGEGACLPAVEAGSCEIPVLITRHGGQMEFLDDEVAYFIETEGSESCKNLKLNSISSYYSNDVMIAKLGEKAINQLAERMIYIINNYEEAKDKAKKLRQKVNDNFTWEIAAHRVIKEISEIG